MMCVSVCVCAYVRVLQGCLADPETQLLALIDFSDREDFPVQGYTPSNRLRSLLAGTGAAISVVKWNLSALVLMRWLGEVTQGPGEVAGRSIAASLYGRKKNLIAEGILQTPWNWQLSTTSPWAGLEVCIIRMKTLLEAQTKGFLFPPFWRETLLWKEKEKTKFWIWPLFFVISSPFYFAMVNAINKQHVWALPMFPVSLILVPRGARPRNESILPALGIRDCPFQERIFPFSPRVVHLPAVWYVGPHAPVNCLEWLFKWGVRAHSEMAAILQKESMQHVASLTRIRPSRWCRQSPW